MTISKTLVDQHTILDITTSLPQSRHEPAYLRPSPPYVRAQVTLLAWCIQLAGAASDPIPPAPGKARITCIWSWNPKGAWAVGGGVPQHLPSLVVGLVDYVREGSEKVPVLLGYGPDVSIGNVSYDTARVTLTVGYAIVNDGLAGENEGLRRQIEFGLSSTQSWDVQIGIKTQHGEESDSTVWTSFVGQAPATITGTASPKRLILRFAHAPLTSGEELVRVTVSIERTSSSGAAGVRINGIPVTVEHMSPKANGRPLLTETASTNAVSLRTLSTMDSELETADVKAMSTKSLAVERNIANLIRRNYICGSCATPWTDDRLHIPPARAGSQMATHIRFPWGSDTSAQLHRQDPCRLPGRSSFCRSRYMGPVRNDSQSCRSSGLGQIA